MKHTIYLTAIIALFTTCKTNANNEAATEATTTVDTNTQITPPTVETTPYNFEAHSDFQAFWTDFKKAVLSNDREAVAKMTNFPFKDEYGGAYKQLTDFDGLLTEDAKKMPSFTCSNKTIFLNKYDKIFLPETKTAIQTNKYRGYEVDEVLGEDMILNEGEYALEFESKNSRSYNLVFSKMNGKYKLDNMPYYP